MRIMSNVTRAFSVALLLMGFNENKVSASLFSSLSLTQAIEYDYGSSLGTQAVLISSTPFHQAVAGDDGHGGTIATTYDVMDTGNVATIKINTSSALTAVNNSVAEATTSVSTFSFSKDVSYVIAITATGQGIASLDIQPYDRVVNIDITNSSRTYTGMIAANYPVNLIESSVLQNVGLGSQYANESGSDSLSMMFTAIPEPSCAAVAVLGTATALVKRRKRVADVQVGQ